MKTQGTKPMYRCAVITDIHGNSPALEAVLHELSYENVDCIFCLGDMLGIGPDSNQVLKVLMSCEIPIYYVLGNHEMAILSALRGEEPPRGHENERNHHEWIAERIDPNYVDFLCGLPLQSIIQIVDRKVLIQHYHLDEDNEFVPIDNEPTAEKLNGLYADNDYDLVCFGHHHVVHNYEGDGKWYLNPGSLGCYDKPLARYGLVEFTKDQLQVTLKETPYDNQRFLKSYIELEVPDREFILNIFHGGQLKPEQT